MKIKIPVSEVQELLSNRRFDYPKYATQIMNLANQNAQGTRARVVGQMSDLIQDFGRGTLSEWESWYLDGHPDSIEQATDKVYSMVELLRSSIDQIDRDLVRQWVEELVIVKTYVGLKFQDVILRKIAERAGVAYRLATAEEESLGIDGYIGDNAVSIKPTTYRAMSELSEHIDVPIIYYEKKSSNIEVEYDLDSIE